MGPQRMSDYILKITKMETQMKREKASQELIQQMLEHPERFD